MYVVKVKKSINKKNHFQLDTGAKCNVFTLADVKKKQQHGEQLILKISFKMAYRWHKGGLKDIRS